MWLEINGKFVNLDNVRWFDQKGEQIDFFFVGQDFETSFLMGSADEARDVIEFVEGIFLDRSLLAKA